MGINDEFSLRQRPTLRFFSHDQLSRIHEASLEILERTGMDFYSPEAVEMLSGAGARVVSEKRVKIPAFMAQDALAAAPKRVVLSNREGKRTIFLERDNVYYGPGSETPFTLDPESGERRPAVKADVVRAAKVVDALPNLDFCMSFALASDITKGCEDLHHFEAMVANTAKPILFTSWDLDGIRGIHDMCVAVKGSQAAFEDAPFICHYVEPIPPLKHPTETIDKLLFSVEKGIPVMYVPVSSAGGTSPQTFASGFALANAEFLGGLILAQLKRRGAPVVYGGGPCPLDPQTSVLPYAAPEVWMSRVIRNEIAHFYGLPCFSTGGNTDSKVLDQQAAYEAGMGLLLSSLAGCNFIHDVGYMEVGLTSSLELLTMCDEMIAHVKRVLRSVEISPETLALDVLHEAGPGGHFLAHPHTVKHFRKELFIGDLMDRRNFQGWEAKGKTTLRDRARAKLLGIMAKHAGNPLPDGKCEDIRRIVADLDARRTGAKK